MTELISVFSLNLPYILSKLDMASFLKNIQEFFYSCSVLTVIDFCFKEYLCQSILILWCWLLLTIKFNLIFSLINDDNLILFTLDNFVIILCAIFFRFEVDWNYQNWELWWKIWYRIQLIGLTMNFICTPKDNYFIYHVIRRLLTIFDTNCD